MQLLLRLGLLSFLAFFGSTFVQSQSASEEIAMLQKHLGVAESVSIKPNLDATILKSSESLKVYLAMGLDLKVSQNFMGWVSRWNESGDSKKHGKIEIVSDLLKCDVVLARYTLNEQARTQTGSTTTAATVWDWKTSTYITRPTEKAYSYSTVPVYAYVLRPHAGGYEIVYRYSSSTTLGESKNSGEQLWDNFRKLVKSQK